MTDQDFEDIELLARLAEGDETALGPLYDRYGKVVYSLALRIVHDSATAEEVTQEVFVRLWHSAGSFEPGRARVHTWLMRIAHNLALNEIRRRRSRPVSADQFDWAEASETLPSTNEDNDPEMVAWLNERAQVIRQALAQLPEPQRQAIEMAFYGGLSQAEIAAALGFPLGTIKSRIRIGMQRLRELFREVGLDAQSDDLS